MAKRELVDLLFEVQTGKRSCGNMADIIINENANLKAQVETGQQEFMAMLMARNGKATLLNNAEREIEALKTIINKAHDVLMDAQPHIQQGIDHGDATAEFLDAHIDIAMSILGQSND